MSENGHEPQKLTPTMRLHEVTLAALNRTTRLNDEKVEISRNAKGDWQFVVAGVEGEDESLEKVANRVVSAVRTLEEQFPLSRKQITERQTLPNEK